MTFSELTPPLRLSWKKGLSDISKSFQKLKRSKKQVSISLIVNCKWHMRLLKPDTCVPAEWQACFKRRRKSHPSLLSFSFIPFVWCQMRTSSNDGVIKGELTTGWVFVKRMLSWSRQEAIFCHTGAFCPLYPQEMKCNIKLLTDWVSKQFLQHFGELFQCGWQNDLATNFFSSKHTAMI